ncbi:MAG: putative nucleotidyltransferase [Thermoleophilaceae bacterium]|nr:putative nucleotidyltransferase [Thermoleophilaceae bacterium]
MRHFAPVLEGARRHAAATAIMTPLVLERVREIVDGPIVLMKGPEIAARYQDPSLRPFNDLDFLVEDPAAAQRALLAAGFEPIGDPSLYEGHHHLRPLRLPSLPLPIELHHEPSWMSWVRAPSAQHLIAQSVPSATGIEGIRALRPDHHALFLAAHGWGHWPLGRALDLVDVLAASEGMSRELLRALARQWNMEKVWCTTIAAADCVIGQRPRLTWPLRTWAAHIPECRRQTPLERRMTHYLPPFAGLALGPASGRALTRIHRQLAGHDRADRRRRASDHPGNRDGR